LRIRAFVTSSIALILFRGPISADPVKVLPPPHGAYHAAYPNFGGTEDRVTKARMAAFESLAGKRIVWAYFSNNWINGIRFPKSAVESIWRSGRVPFVRMMPRSDFSGGGPDPVYTMQRIIDGDFDAALVRWAIAAGKTGRPLVVEFGTEVNGDWFPWNGRYNGGGTKNRYGDPTVPDGPERFRDAYRHIIDVFRAQKADDITWVFHVNAGSWPRTSWNKMAPYYPGHDYIDWIGVSVYGSQVPGDEWESFTDNLDDGYPELCAISPNKPLALLEFGVCEDPESGDKAAWIRDALRSVRDGRYPRIRAVSYWHERWENDDGSISNLRIDSSPEALEAYRKGISSAFFVTTPRFSGGRDSR